MNALGQKKAPKHDHRQSLWVLGGGGGVGLLWCYQCGAVRSNIADGKWHRPVGIGGKNPAVTRMKASSKRA